MGRPVARGGADARRSPSPAGRRSRPRCCWWTRRCCRSRRSTPCSPRCVTRSCAPVAIILAGVAVDARCRRRPDPGAGQRAVAGGAGRGRGRVPGRRAGRAGAPLRRTAAGLRRSVAVRSTARHAGRAGRGPHRPRGGHQRRRRAARPPSAPGRARAGRPLRRAARPAAGRVDPRSPRSRAGRRGKASGCWSAAFAPGRRPGCSTTCRSPRWTRWRPTRSTATARALLRRPAPVAGPGRASAGHAARERRAAAGSDPLQDTLVAVARSNGRVAPAARLLGVHRNTVLYRLRRARDERGLDPRRPAGRAAHPVRARRAPPRPTH